MRKHSEDSMLSRLLRWHAGETPGPWRITLFPTNRCNLHCRICWQRGAEGLEKTEETPAPRLMELVDEAAEMGVREWVIIGGGEPLVRADTVTGMCERIRSHGMNGVLQTNGTLLKPDIIRRLLDMGWPRVNISLDGPTREINDAIRSDGSFDRATGNIRLMNELKRERNACAPSVGLYTVITSANFDKISDMVELAHELGCEGGIELTTMVVHSDMGAPFQLQKEHKDALPRHIAKAIDLAEAYSIPNNFGIYLQEHIVQDPNAMGKQHSRGKGNNLVDSMCYEPWLSVAITAEGVVGPCCAFWDPNAESIQKMSFREAWLGPYLQNMRKRLVENHLPGYCSRCPSILFAQSEVLRAQLRLELMAPHERAIHLLHKAANSVRRYGLRHALRRGMEWVQIHARSR